MYMGKRSRGGTPSLERRSIGSSRDSTEKLYRNFKDLAGSLVQVARGGRALARSEIPTYTYYVSGLLACLPACLE